MFSSIELLGAAFFLDHFAELVVAALPVRLLALYRTVDRLAPAARFYCRAVGGAGGAFREEHGSPFTNLGWLDKCPYGPPLLLKRGRAPGGGCLS